MTAKLSTGAKAGIFLFLAAVLAFLFATSMAKNLNHDEHQFIAPAAVLAYDRPFVAAIVAPVTRPPRTCTDSRRPLITCTPEAFASSSRYIPSC